MMGRRGETARVSCRRRPRSVRLGTARSLRLTWAIRVFGAGRPSPTIRSRTRAIRFMVGSILTGSTSVCSLSRPLPKVIVCDAIRAQPGRSRVHHLRALRPAEVTSSRQSCREHAVSRRHSSGRQAPATIADDFWLNPTRAASMHMHMRPGLSLLAAYGTGFSGPRGSGPGLAAGGVHVVSAQKTKA